MASGDLVRESDILGNSSEATDCKGLAMPLQPPSVTSLVCTQNIVVSDIPQKIESVEKIGKHQRNGQQERPAPDIAWRNVTARLLPGRD